MTILLSSQSHRGKTHNRGLTPRRIVVATIRTNARIEELMRVAKMIRSVT